MKPYGLIILAAGGSSRLGKPKQLLGYKNKNLLQHIVTTALKVNNTSAAVVIGAEEQKMQEALQQSNINIIINNDWQLGMSSSIKIGLTEMAAINPSMKACIFTVCDQPFITVDLLEKLISTHEQTGKGIVAASYQATAGTPVLFSLNYFSQLQLLKDDEGAKKLLQKNFNDLATIDFENGEIDIDTEDDYKKLLDADR